MSDQGPRKRWMGLMARAPGARLAALAEMLPDMPSYAPLRAPEIGGVMVQGRMGGTGQPFNLGEMTVTRASVQIAVLGAFAPILAFHGVAHGFSAT